MDAIGLFYAAPFDALLRDAPWRGGELALLGLLPGALLHRHPALRMVGAWAGYSAAVLAHACAVTWLLGPEALGFPFIAREGEDVRAFIVANLLPLQAYVVVWVLLEKRNPRLVDQEETHLRGLWARMRSWAAGRPQPQRH